MVRVDRAILIERNRRPQGLRRVDASILGFLPDDFDAANYAGVTVNAAVDGSTFTEPDDAASE